MTGYHKKLKSKLLDLVCSGKHSEQTTAAISRAKEFLARPNQWSKCCNEDCAIMQELTSCLSCAWIR